MKKRVAALAVLSIFCTLFLFGCNDSGRIWEGYRKESFSATVSYDIEGITVCARVSVTRSESGDGVRAEFSSPDSLRGAVGRCDGGEVSLLCEGIEITGEGARAVMALPMALGASEASGFEIIREKEEKTLVASVEDGYLFFDMESGELTAARLCDIECKIISFSKIKQNGE